MSIKEAIKSQVEHMYEELVAHRRHLHAHPELSFQEKETSSYIKRQLDKIGVSYTDGWAGYGIVATVKGDKGPGRKIGLRGDMDALPIIEANDVPYKSKNDGIMHACGHDVHTTCLLGTVSLLHAMRDSFSGEVMCIFQPGEEKLPGGAGIMIKEGLFKDGKPDAMFALHVHPPMEVGSIGFRPGMYMASADEIYLKVIGKGGHAALPQNFTDTVLMASKIMVALQEVTARSADPTTPTVLSFGKINSEGGATNVIPDVVNIEGTLRTMDEKWRVESHKIITRIAEKTAESMGGKCEVDIRVGYPYLHNDEELTKWAKETMLDYLDKERVVDLPLRMTAEDFAYFSHETAACFMRLGTGNKSKGITSPVHTTTFDIDEEALKVGVNTMAYLALSFLREAE